MIQTHSGIHSRFGVHRARPNSHYEVGGPPSQRSPWWSKLDAISKSLEHEQSVVAKRCGSTYVTFVKVPPATGLFLSAGSVSHTNSAVRESSAWSALI